ncbi:MAG: NifU family protein [Planctomycetota bacterium]|nr:NifU family protein [Planctomycetota bacterium]
MADQQTDGIELTDRARERLGKLRYVGEFTEQDATDRRCRLVATVHGADTAVDHITLHWLVDEAGYIRDVRFRSSAVGLDLLAFDLMAELCVGVTSEQAARITPAHIQERLRLVYDQDEAPMPWDASAPFPVLQKAAGRGLPAATSDDGEQAERPGADWPMIGLFEKVRRIEGVLDEHVRPMLASDGGGMDLIDLRENNTLFVEYNGACGSCSSSIGGTLFFIEDSLETHLGVRLKIEVQGTESEPFLDL